MGAGAAGLVAAVFSARSGARTLLLESRPQPGAKIRASGGGRCNVLPSSVAPADFHTSGSVAALRNILLSWPLPAVRDFFERDLAVPLKLEASGKLFPVDDDPRRVVQALLSACRDAGVALWGDWRTVRVEAAAAPDVARFRLTSARGATLACDRLVLATGGKSLPKTGSDGGGYLLAGSLGHSVVAPYPALVPLVSGDRRWGRLAGVSLPVRLRVVRGERVVDEQEGAFLFTHRGFSGPVVLNLSRHFTGPGGGDARLVARWGGGGAPAWDGLLQHGGAQPATALVARHLPRRLAQELAAAAGLAETMRCADLDRRRRLALVSLLEECVLDVAGSEGWRVAEVTGGGIPLAEVSPRTLESRVAPGLFLAGEMLDGTGRIGGFNFLWAWVTGRKAGLGAAGATGGRRRAVGG